MDLTIEETIDARIEGAGVAALTAFVASNVGNGLAILFLQTPAYDTGLVASLSVAAAAIGALAGPASIKRFRRKNAPAQQA